MTTIWVPIIYWLLTQATIGAALGQHFRASPWQGFFGGLGFGPLGWALIYFIQDKRNKCSYCLEPVRTEASACPHCGQELQRSLPSQSRRASMQTPSRTHREFVPPASVKTSNPRDPDDPGTVIG
jgi:hypothetical protein